jgi:hypothetical protein
MVAVRGKRDCSAPGFERRAPDVGPRPLDRGPLAFVFQPQIVTAEIRGPTPEVWGATIIRFLLSCCPIPLKGNLPFISAP